MITLHQVQICAYYIMQQSFPYFRAAIYNHTLIIDNFAQLIDPN